MAGFDFDIVVLGSGMAGSLTAILCRALGLSVLLVERTDHPHFAIGEAVTGEVMRRLDYLAGRYHVPLIAQLSSYSRIKRAGLPIATWPKSHITFVRHEVGKRVDPARPEEVLVQASTWPLGPDAHAYRPEFDMLLKNAAVERGATYLPHTEALSFGFDPVTGASLVVREKGRESRTVTCRLVVDATGPACWLSRQLGVYRHDSLDVPMSSAAIFAHFRKVRSWESVLGAAPLVFSRDQGTILHVGAHGLFWVIPFDNGITSAGWVTGDPLPPDGDGETLFWEMLRQRPSMAEHMRGAEPVTRFYKIDRVQYSAERIAGDGWFLLPASSEFSDPLFSVGMPLTLASISRLMWRLEKVDSTRPVSATDLAGLDETFRLESKYIRKFTKATKRCFLDFGLLNWALNLNRLLVFREGGYIGASTSPESATAAAWGVDDENVRRIIDHFYDGVMATDFSKPVSDETRRQLDAAVRPWDVAGFLDTPFGRMRADAIYLNSIPRLVSHFWRARNHPLGLGKLGAFRQVSRRWFESFSTLRPSGTAPPLPTVDGLVKDQLRALVQL